jgi:ATP-binding cassette subfamily B protein
MAAPRLLSHRLSTLHKANRLVVMDQGQIVEIGNHDELMASEGAYYRLYQAQARNVDTDLDDVVSNETIANKEASA